MYKHPLYILSFCASLILGCAKKEPANQTRESSLHKPLYTTDSTLLQPNPFIDPLLEFSMFIPKAYNPAHPSLLHTLTHKLITHHDRNVRIRAGYIHPKDSALIILLDVSKVAPSAFQSLRANYPTLCKQDSAWHEVQFQKFTHNGLNIDQYILHNDSVTSFNLICYPQKNGSRPAIEVIYLIPQKKYRQPQTIKAIESSIGSLRSLVQ